MTQNTTPCSNCGGPQVPSNLGRPVCPKCIPTFAKPPSAHFGPSATPDALKSPETLRAERDTAQRNLGRMYDVIREAALIADVGQQDSNGEPDVIGDGPDCIVVCQELGTKCREQENYIYRLEQELSLVVDAETHKRIRAMREEKGADEELWEADPECEHNIQHPPGGGIKCTKCGGWFCY